MKRPTECPHCGYSRRVWVGRAIGEPALVCGDCGKSWTAAAGEPEAVSK